MLWYDITFSLDKAVSPSLQGSTALALFSAGKIHSADQPATANPYCPKSYSGAIQLPFQYPSIGLSIQWKNQAAKE